MVCDSESFTEAQADGDGRVPSLLSSSLVGGNDLMRVNLAAATVALAGLMGLAAGEAAAVDWSLVLENRGTATDPRSLWQPLGGPKVPGITTVTCEPGDRYSLQLITGKHTVKLKVGSYVSLQRYRPPRGLETRVMRKPGKRYSRPPHSAFALAKKELECSPLGQQQFLVGDLWVKERAKRHRLTFQVVLKPRRQVDLQRFLLKQPRMRAGLDQSEMALAVALSHLVYYDNRDDFVAQRLEDAGFTKPGGSIDQLTPETEALETADPDPEDPAWDPSAASDPAEIEKIGNHFYLTTRPDRRDRDVVYVTVRGTSGGVDWLYNLSCSYSGGLLHLGFLSYAREVLRALEADYGAYLTDSETRFFLTGHSLGGATATLLSLLLHDEHDIPFSRMKTVTLGAPRSVGTQRAKSADRRDINQLVLRHLHDPVPQAFRFCLPVPLATYRHLGDLYRLHHGGADWPFATAERDKEVGGWDELADTYLNYRATHHNLLAYYNTISAGVGAAPPQVGATRLNDTGITACGDGGSNDLPCPVADYPGQDAELGRDVTHNDDRDGHAGFSFTKLDAKGRALPASATDWSCVRDNVTGLVWEVKTDDGGLRDRDWTYSWYNPDPTTNGGFAGYEDAGDDCFDPDRCDTHKYVADVNSQGLCGASDWRLASVDELLSIVANDRYGPAIDTVFFPGTRDDWFWSSSPYAYGSSYAWYVDFSYGYVNYYYKDNQLYVRLVRGGQ